MSTTAMMTKTTDALRREYRAIRSRSEACHSKREFDAAVQAYLTEKNLPLTPENFVEAAKCVRFRCGRCAGTGRFITRVVNGVPCGPGGACFRCNGRGSQNDADARRNYGADLHMMSRAI